MDRRLRDQTSRPRQGCHLAFCRLINEVPPKQRRLGGHPEGTRLFGVGRTSFADRCGVLRSSRHRMALAGGSDGGYPGGGVTLDANGGLLGTAVLGGANGFGVIYQITP